jgi:hypothetical protein
MKSIYCNLFSVTRVLLVLDEIINGGISLLYPPDGTLAAKIS